MSKKELEFSVKMAMDQQSLNDTVKSIQKRMDEIKAPVEFTKTQAAMAQSFQKAGVTGVSSPAQEKINQATQKYHKELNVLLADEAKLYRASAMEIEKYGQSINLTVEKLKKLKEGTEEYKNVEKELGIMRSNMSSRMRLDEERFGPTKRMMDESIAGAPPTGGGRAGMAQVGAMGNVAGAVAAILGAGAEVYKQIYEAPLRTQLASGTAMEGIFGRDIQAARNGRGVYEAAYLPEKLRASEVAAQQDKSSRIYDKLALAAGGIAAIGSVLTGGAAVAGTIGTGGLAAPGTIPLGIASATLGGFAGGMLGGSQEHRALLMSNVLRSTPLGETASKYYESLKSQQFAENLSRSLEASKQLNPYKELAAGDYADNLMRSLEFERQTGLGTQGFRGRGGFRETVENAGFTADMGMAASQQILGAGGSTRAAREAAFSLQAQRGLNLTNAGQVLGTLSGGLGSAGASKEAAISIFAEGIRKGLGTDDFAEENRRFVQATAQAVVAAGASTAAGASAVGGRFAEFMAEPTTKGIEAAQTAYQVTNQAMSQTSGWGGAVRAAGILRDDKLNKMSTIDRAAFQMIPADQATEDNESLIDLSDRYGIPIGELVQKKRKIDQSGLHRLAAGDQLTESIRAKKLAVAQSPIQNFKAWQEIPAEERHLGNIFRVERPELANDPRALKAAVAGTTAINEMDRKRAYEEFGPEVKKRMEGATGKVEDEGVRVLAEQSKVLTQSFQQFGNEITTSAKVVAEYNAAMRQHVEDAKKNMSPAELERFYQDVRTRIGVSPKTQSQASTK